MMSQTKPILAALALALAAAPAAAQELEDPPGHDRERGEISPGTEAPSVENLMNVITTIDEGSPNALFTLLEYGERVECHACVPLLEAEILENDDARVREIAAWWLRRRPFGFAAVMRDMRVVLATDADPVRRARAAEAIGEFMEPAGIAHLEGALADVDARVREAAVHGLARINRVDANAVLVTAFEDADASVREAAVGEVLYVNFFPYRDELLGRLADEAPTVRRRAALALGTLGETAAVPALVGLLEGDADPMVRQASAWALGRLGTGDARAALRGRQGVEDNRRVLDAIEVGLQR
ncbi:MAG: HEAT repeat domain-containing protein [Sandaracinaceae bacterium]